MYLIQRDLKGNGPDHFFAIDVRSFAAVLKLAAVSGWEFDRTRSSYLSGTIGATEARAIAEALERAWPAVRDMSRHAQFGVDLPQAAVLDPVPSSLRWEESWDQPAQTPLMGFAAPTTRGWVASMMVFCARGGFRIAAKLPAGSREAMARVRLKHGVSVDGHPYGQGEEAELGLGMVGNAMAFGGELLVGKDAA